MEKKYEEKVIVVSLVLKNRNSSSLEQLCLGCSWDFVPHHKDLALRLCLSSRSGEMKASSCGGGFCSSTTSAVIAARFGSQSQSGM